MTSRALALGLVAALLGAGSVHAQAPVPPTGAVPPKGAVKVSGRVVMGTKSAALPTDLSVTIVGLDGNRETYRTQVTPSADGIWATPGVTTVTQRFVVAVVYKDVTYSNILEQGGSLDPAPDLLIYEPTSNVSVVSVLSDTTTVVQGKEGGTLEVLQLLRMANSSDRTFVGTALSSGAHPVAIVRVPVPQGAFDVLPTDDMNRRGLGRTQEGIAATAPLLPGESTISYVYRVRAPRTGWQLRREVFYPTAKTDILIGPALELKAGPGFSFAETVELGGKTYRRYRGEKLLPGAVLGVDIGHAGAAGGGLWFGLVGIVAALIAVVIAGAVIRRRRSRSGTEDKSDTRASVVEQIALLDIEHEAGAISDDDHRNKREDMKSKLTGGFGGVAAPRGTDPGAPEAANPPKSK